MSKQVQKRKYEKRARAASDAQTRLRITEAAVDLHGTVGPAKTTMSAVAERAGVQRATLYRHFPDERALFTACSTHWAMQNPPPDPTPWAEIGDPERRLRVALAELYAYYERTEAMTSNILRDVTLVPSIAEAMQPFIAYGEWVQTLLAQGRPGARRKKLRGAIAHTTSFDTWRSLVRDQGLSRRDAVDLAAGMVAAASKARR
jgi:AcrR family transcriptional regulator